MARTSNTRHCNHCDRSYVYRGTFNTLCSECEAAGHIAPYQGVCQKCKASAEQQSATINVPKEPVKQALRKRRRK